MEVKVVGKLRTTGETIQVSDKFKKRQIVIDTDEQFSQAVGIDFVQDKVDLLNNYKQGDNVSVSVNIRGSEYNGKFYVNLQGWRIEKDEEAPASTPPAKAAKEPKPFPMADPHNEEDFDDLPF